MFIGYLLSKAPCIQMPARRHIHFWASKTIWELPGAMTRAAQPFMLEIKAEGKHDGTSGTYP
ncbi:MAG: hypothetical protein OEZ19_05655, partial [Paracoccaceae bacterium]|nr:hypothetical protein [Paracoccaceae bacterium]